MSIIHVHHDNGHPAKAARVYSREPIQTCTYTTSCRAVGASPVMSSPASCTGMQPRHYMPCLLANALYVASLGDWRMWILVAESCSMASRLQQHMHSRSGMSNRRFLKWSR